MSLNGDQDSKLLTALCIRTMLIIGSYGEIGHSWILASLWDIYPKESIGTEGVLPMSVSGFLSEVLVMEAAVLLIRERERCGWNEAKEILEQSARYGYIMFRDTNGDAAEELVKKLARESQRQQRANGEDILDLTKEDTVSVKPEPVQEHHMTMDDDIIDLTEGDAAVKIESIDDSQWTIIFDSEGNEVIVVE